MKYYFYVLCLLSTLNVFAQDSTLSRINLADPTILLDRGTYYLYGTGKSAGFLVYTSTDMKNWKGPAGIKEGYALFKNDAFGYRGFWAPHVFFHNNKFHMAYTA